MEITGLCWSRTDLPEGLRDLPAGAAAAAKGVYNAIILSGRKGDPVALTLKELRGKQIIP